MLPRLHTLALALLVLATLASAPAGLAQTRDGDLSDLWRQYPLDSRDEEPRPVGAREERGSTAGPPPAPATPAGPLPLALLFLALALAIVGVAGGTLRALGRLRGRRRERAGLGAGAGNLGG